MRAHVHVSEDAQSPGATIRLGRKRGQDRPARRCLASLGAHRTPHQRAPSVGRRPREADRIAALYARRRHRRASAPGCFAATSGISSRSRPVQSGACTRAYQRAAASRTDSRVLLMRSIWVMTGPRGFPLPFSMQTARARLMCFSTIFTEMPQCAAISGYVMRRTRLSRKTCRHLGGRSSMAARSSSSSCLRRNLPFR